VEIAAHLVYELDPDGKQLRVVKFSEYAAEKVRTLYPSAADLRKQWADPALRADIIAKLEERGSTQLRDELKRENEDRFVFSIAEGSEEQLPVQSVKTYRFLVETRLDGRRFENIKVDVGIGGCLIASIEEVAASDLLSFAGISIPVIRVTSRAQHFAEKLHAVTRPFEDRINTRVKDLADLMLFIDHAMIRPSDVKIALNEVFRIRKTHEIPSKIQNPPATWATSYNTMAVCN
jgi:predicted nucleotidyltransferase component of viral defense system